MKLKETLPLSILSEWRTELMGLAAILIIICHSTAYIHLPKVLSYVLSLGNVGNEIFLFLSGMGLYYSLNKRMGGAKKWYIRRYRRIMMPYLILAIPIGAYFCFINQKTILDYFLYLSTLSYWSEHNTAWFVAVLIPLYLITPFLFAIQEKKGNILNIGLIVICYVIGLINVAKGDTLFSNIIYNVVYVMPKIPAFLLGLCLAKYIKEGKTFPVWWLGGMVIMALGVLFLTKHIVYSYLFLLFPVLYFLLFIIENVSIRVRSAMRFMGDISLESYLCNTMLPIILLPLCPFLGKLNTGYYLFYIILIVIGIAMATLIHKYCKVR